MCFKRLWLSKGFVTELTVISPLIAVDKEMPHHVGLLIKGAFTDLTHPWSQTSVSELMSLQVVLLKIQCDRGQILTVLASPATATKMMFWTE